jgi:hypothetical protein
MFNNGPEPVSSHARVDDDPRSVDPDDAGAVPLGSSGVVGDDDLLPDGSIPSWGVAAHRLPERIDGSPYPAPTFGRTWSRRTRARLLDADSEARQWAETTALITLTSSPRLPGSDTLSPPTSVLSSLTATREPRQRRLRRELDGVQWEWIRVVAPHRSGYPHIHQLLYVDHDDLDLLREVGRSAVDAHVGGCPLATDDDHGEGAVSVSTTTDDPRGIRYLAGQLPGVAGLVRADDDDLDGEAGTLRGDSPRVEAERRVAVAARTLGCDVSRVSPGLT